MSEASGLQAPRRVEENQHIAAGHCCACIHLASATGGRHQQMIANDATGIPEIVFVILLQRLLGRGQKAAEVLFKS